MAIALPVPIAAFSGMAIPLPTAIERIAAALVSGHTDIVSDVDAVAIEVAQAAQLEEEAAAPAEPRVLFLGVNAASADSPPELVATFVSAPAPELSVTQVSLADPAASTQLLASWVAPDADPTVGTSGESPGGGTGGGTDESDQDDNSTGSGGSGSGGSGFGDPGDGGSSPTPTIAAPVTPTKADDADDASDDADKKPKARERVKNANAGRSSRGRAKPAHEPDAPPEHTFIEVVSPNLDARSGSPEPRDGVPEPADEGERRRDSDRARRGPDHKGRAVASEKRADHGNPRANKKAADLDGASADAEAGKRGKPPKG